MEIKLTNAGYALQQARSQRANEHDYVKEQQEKVAQSRRWAMTPEGKRAMGAIGFKNGGKFSAQA